MSKPKTRTRYECVIEILNNAAGESTSDYGGIGRFWELKLKDFLDIEVAGVRMIAPRETVTSCNLRLWEGRL